MNKFFCVMALLLMSLSSCKQQSDILTDNPFMAEYDTPFGVPCFDKIKIEHYRPALEEGIAAAKAEIQSIIDNKETPTFENTIEALEYSGALIEKVQYVFGNALEIDGTDQMNELAMELIQLLSSYSDGVMMNKELFAKVKAVYDQKSSLNLNEQQNRLLDETYKSFVRSGALLTADQQERMKVINERMSMLNLSFENNVRAETNNFLLVIDNKEDLAGLSDSFISSMAEEAKAKGQEGKWVVTLDSPSIWPFLQMSSRRDLREKVYKAYLTRGNNDNDNDNKANLLEQAKLRAEKAQLLGYKNYAAYVADGNMSKTPEAIDNLLMQIWEPALKQAKKELADIKIQMNKDGIEGDPECWDWRYYSEKVRLERYNLDENMIRPYFKLENVINGIFTVADSLYGLKFKSLTNIPLCHPEAVAYEVTESDGRHIGIMYMDFYPRPTKGQGAWMTEYRSQHVDRDGNFVTPIVSLVFNFTKPSGDEPALLTIDETETMFHEFGHGLHGLLSNNYYKSLSGTNVPTDFVELPSQIMEHWSIHPQVLKLYAKHYKTGEIIPDELIKKISESGKFNQGYTTTELTAASLLDQYYHIRSVGDPEIKSVNGFEDEVFAKLGLIRQVPTRYHSTYFKHIFGGGYSAGYYSYQWAEVLDSDAFNAFEENGIFNKETATSFRKNILERGNSEDQMSMYIKFRGHEPSIEPMLRNRGFL